VQKSLARNSKTWERMRSFGKLAGVLLNMAWQLKIGNALDHSGKG
jgi:hypothetical protein